MLPRLLALALLLVPGLAFAGVKENVRALAPSGTVLVMDENGNELVAQNADAPFVPASVAKIVTAWLADGGARRGLPLRDALLPGRRPEALRARGRRSLPHLGGAGSARADLVAAIGKEPVTGIVLDASYYPSDLRIPGIENTSEAYDALNTALAVNFNDQRRTQGNTVRAPEQQTPSRRSRSASSWREARKVAVASA